MTATTPEERARFCAVWAPACLAACRTEAGAFRTFCAIASATDFGRILPANNPWGCERGDAGAFLLVERRADHTSHDGQALLIRPLGRFSSPAAALAARPAVLPLDRLTDFERRELASYFVAVAARRHR